MSSVSGITVSTSVAQSGGAPINVLDTVAVDVPEALVGTVPDNVSVTESPAAKVLIVQMSVDGLNVTPTGRSGLVTSSSP